MLGWSMHLFRIRGIRLELHFTTLFLFGIVGALGWADSGWAGVAWGCGMIVAFLTCVTLHELGHSFTGMCFGVRVPRILLTPLGGMAEFDAIPRQPRREILMTLAGPAVNFVLVGVFWFVPLDDASAERLSLTGIPHSWAELGVAVLWVNLVMGCFNLFVPAFPMDGGRILRAVLATRLPYVRATFWAATLGKVLALAGVAFALSAHWLGVNDEPLYTLAILFLVIFFVGEVEYRAVRRQEAEAAHWDTVFARPAFSQPGREE